MKLTKNELRQFIEEEVQQAIKEVAYQPGSFNNPVFDHNKTQQTFFQKTYASDPTKSVRDKHLASTALVRAISYMEGSTLAEIRDVLTMVGYLTTYAIGKQLSKDVFSHLDVPDDGSLDRPPFLK